MKSHNESIIYVQMATKKYNISPSHLLNTRPTFNMSDTLSYAVSKFVGTKVIFVEPGLKSSGSTVAAGAIASDLQYYLSQL